MKWTCVILLICGCHKKDEFVDVPLGAVTNIQAHSSLKFRIRNPFDSAMVSSDLWVSNTTATNITITFPTKEGLVNDHGQSVFHVDSYGKKTNIVWQLDVK